MKFSQLVVVSALFGPAFGAAIKRNPTMDIYFYKYDNECCVDDGVGNYKKLETGECKTFDNKFTYFSYEPREHEFGVWHHNDFNDRRCAVAVYEYGGCLGRRYSWDTWPESRNMCVFSPFDAKAVGVKCDGTIFPGLYDPPGGSLDFT